MKKLLAMMVAFFMLSACQTTGKTVKYTTSSGYVTDGLVYLPDTKKSDDIVFVIMHGKSSRPDVPFRLELYHKLSRKGYEVIAPKMPWSKEWEGTPEDGIALINEVVRQVARKGKKVVLIGHSLGGANALIYAAKNPAKEVIGIIAVAPGHMIHRSRKTQEVTAHSVKKAQDMVKSGKGNEKGYFTELNTGRINYIHTTADIYLSYYDIEKFPNIEQLLPHISLPVLWIAGDRDRLTRIYNMEILFENLPDNQKSKYMENSGGHKSVLANSADDIVNWAKTL